MRLAWILSVLLLSSLSVSAQPRSERRVSAIVGPVTFSPDLAADQGGFRFDRPVFGIAYTADGMYAAILRGTADDEITGLPARMELLDFTLAANGTAFSWDIGRGSAVYLPLGLRSAYRRIRSTRDNLSLDSFEYTSIGIGAGGGIRLARGRTRFAARSMPSIGFATRSLGNSTGWMMALDTDAELVIAPLLGRFGLTLGYGYVWQSWNVGGPDALGAAAASKVDYRGSGHLFRMGIAW